jgi:general secretion pathway protein D
VKIVGVLVILLLCESCFTQETGSSKTVKVNELDLREIPLQEAVRLISEETELNIVASAEARKTPVSIYLKNVTANAAIEELCKTHNLWFKQDEKSNIIRIMTLPEFQRDLVTVREEKTEVFTLLYPNAVAIAFAIRDLHGDRVQLSIGTEGARDESQDLEERFDRFDVVDQRSQGLGLFQAGGSSSFSGAGSNRFSSSSGDNDFSGSSSSRASRRSDVVRGSAEARRQERADEFSALTPEQAESVQKMIKSGDTSAQAARALESLRRQAADVFVTVSRKNNMLMVRTSDATSMKDIKELVTKMDVPTPMVLLEVKVLSLELGDGFNSVFEYQFSDGVNNAAGFSSGTIQPPPSDILSGQVRKFAPLTIGGTGGRAGDLMFQFVNENFRARIQLLEDKNKVTVLATPMLLTANNEVSRLFVGEERPIIRNISSQTVVNDNSVTSVPNTTVEFRPVGTTLLITPNINSDRTVTLRILQENSAILPRSATIPVVTGEGSVQEQAVDVVSTRTVSGTLIAKDGLMVAVGGLIEDSLRDQRAQVPVLGRIPVLGIPFRRQNTGRNRRELIVLCRPHILSTPSEAEELSKKLVKELSLHPKAPDGNGAMPTFAPREVMEPDPPTTRKKAIFRLDSIKNNDD